MSREQISFAELEEQCRLTPPLLALVLGSGLGPVAGRLRDCCTVGFADIPGMPAAGVAGHRGCLSLGDWMGVCLLVFEGRAHFYEGHPWERVVLPMRMAARLGARQALLTNASGGIAEHLGPGSLLAVNDHLDCTRPNWWRNLGPRPSPYSARLQALLAGAARTARLALASGVYAAMLGPCYETPAEVRALRLWGADAVGMSTAREVEAAVAAGMECAAVSCVANWAAGLGEQPLSHEDVLASVRAQAERLGDLIEQFLGLLRPAEGEPPPSGGGDNENKGLRQDCPKL
jgi:purine-nucleoside phosphorylase